MTREEFEGLLDPNNRQCEDLVSNIELAATAGWGHGIFLERKGPNLLETIQKCCEKKLFPLIDKKLSLVFGLSEGFHELIRHGLYDYHTATLYPDEGRSPMYEGALYYLLNGMGYYISAMRPDTIVCHGLYKQDRYDKDVFLTYKIHYDAAF